MSQTVKSRGSIQALSADCSLRMSARRGTTPCALWSHERQKALRSSALRATSPCAAPRSTHLPPLKGVDYPPPFKGVKMDTSRRPEEQRGESWEGEGARRGPEEEDVVQIRSA